MLLASINTPGFFPLYWFVQFPLTLPTVVADAQLLPSEVAVAVVGAPAVVPTVWDVASFPFPVFVAFTVHSAGG